MANTHETLTSLFTDVADAIREKTETTDTIVADNFPDAIRGISTGIEINGLIESYKVAAGENISAGDFVSYLNGDVKAGTDTLLASASTYTGYFISAIALDESRVFIAHSYASTSSVFAMVCTISGTTITAGTDTELYTATNAAYGLNVVKLSDNKIFVTFGYGSNYNNIYAMVCTINNTTITIGSVAGVSSQIYACQTVSVVPLSDSKVFIAHQQGKSTHTLYGVVCTISGTTITAGSDTLLSDGAYTGFIISAVALDDNRVFIAHSQASSSYYLYGMVCTISGTTITAGTDTALSKATTYTGYRISAVFLSENKVFIAHSYSGSYYLYGMVVTINGTTITAGTDTELSTENQPAYRISAVALSEDKVFIAHADTLYGMMVSISGTSVIKDSDIQLSTVTSSGYAISAVALDDNKVFIAHSGDSSYYLYGISINCASGITALSDTIFGIAKTGGTSGEEIEVYVPYPLPTFTFYIEDYDNTFTCSATDSMTWAEWVASEYNIDGFTVDSDGYIVEPDGWVVAYSENSYVKSEDVIVAGTTYITTM